MQLVSWSIQWNLNNFSFSSYSGLRLDIESLLILKRKVRILSRRKSYTVDTLKNPSIGLKPQNMDVAVILSLQQHLWDNLIVSTSCIFPLRTFSCLSNLRLYHYNYKQGKPWKKWCTLFPFPPLFATTHCEVIWEHQLHIHFLQELSVACQI